MYKTPKIKTSIETNEDFNIKDLLTWLQKDVVFNNENEKLLPYIENTKLTQLLENENNNDWFVNFFENNLINFDKIA